MSRRLTRHQPLQHMTRRVLTTNNIMIIRTSHLTSILLHSIRHLLCQRLRKRAINIPTDTATGAMTLRHLMAVSTILSNPPRRIISTKVAVNQQKALRRSRLAPPNALHRTAPRRILHAPAQRRLLIRSCRIRRLSLDGLRRVLCPFSSDLRGWSGGHRRREVPTAGTRPLAKINMDVARRAVINYIAKV